MIVPIAAKRSPAARLERRLVRLVICPDAAGRCLVTVYAVFSCQSGLETPTRALDRIRHPGSPSIPRREAHPNLARLKPLDPAVAPQAWRRCPLGGRLPHKN